MATRSTWRKRATILLVVASLLGGAGAGVVWWKFFREGDQHFATDADRFNYGSLDTELIAGIPYPIFMILPRVFPDLVEKYATEGYGPEKAGHGGYGAFGLAWEEGQRLPIGFSIKQRGFERVTINCALCHTTSYRLKADDKPSFAYGGQSHTFNFQGLLRFLFAAANDRRFTAARLLPEIILHFDLDWIDWPIYSAILIPKTRWALQAAERQMGWMETKPAWAPGRDDAFNLPKYLLTQSPWDDTVGNTDFPALWQMGDREGHLVHTAGQGKSVHAVIASSALGIASLPGLAFDERNRWLEAFLRDLKPPSFPAPLDAQLVAQGHTLFGEYCSACHAKSGARTGTTIPLEEIGTDPEHIRTWTQENANRMNAVTRTLGAPHAEMQGAQGYVAKPLTGVWLLAPYLHNGSVPTLWELLSPPEARPKSFHRGYDVLDLERVGFRASAPDAVAKGFRFETAARGNSNGGHLYGTALPDWQKRALIEFLKTL